MECGIEAGDQVTQLKLRSYQQEMLEESMRRNLIVAMDTGSGKTHIAIARILVELERSGPCQLIWFLTPSVALSNQQHAIIQEHLNAYRCVILTGSEGVDTWTDQCLWDAFLTNVRVVVGTPDVLADALTHGFISISRLNLLVFDEAHNCRKNSPMNRIMKNFYHPLKSDHQHVPHILGLTASPVISNKPGKLEEIEVNLDAIAVTPKHQRKTLEQYVHSPEVIRIAYHQPAAFAFPSGCASCDALHEAAHNYDFSTDPFVLDLMQRDDERSKQILQKLKIKNKTYCSDQLRILDRRATTLYEQLGRPSAEWYILSYIKLFRSSFQDVGLLPDISMKEQQHLMQILERVSTAHHNNRDAIQTAVHTDKVEQLFTLLSQRASASCRAIIFVEQRAVVSALTNLLHTAGIDFGIGGFVGASTFTSKRTTVADLSEARQYLQDLEDFRTGKKNLIVTTSVLEEGIDVSACNLVVCFDLPKNLVSFVQRRGRARQNRSAYCLFVAEGDLTSHASKWQALEAEMKQAYMSDREQHEHKQENEDEVSKRVYRVHSTGAVLTLENAKAHLYHLCAVSTLQSSKYVDLRPEFSTQQAEIPGTWTAYVTLPSFVHPDIRISHSSQPWHKEDTAIKDAAFQSYVRLHKEGLVNDNLLPVTRDYGPSVGEHVDQPSLVNVANQFDSWLRMSEMLATRPKTWHTSTVSVNPINTAGTGCSKRDGANMEINMLMMLPVKIQGMIEIHLFWNERTRLQVKVESSSPTSYGPVEMKNMIEATYTMLSAVNSHCTQSVDIEYIALFCPVVPSLQAWIGESTGTIPAIHYFSRANDQLDCGLIRTRAQVGRAFIYDKQSSEQSCASEASQNRTLVVKSFPKRRNFLHSVAERTSMSIASTAAQTLPANECTVDRLPYQYALFAAFVPSIMHHMDIQLLAQELQSTVIRDVQIHQTHLIIEAISAPVAGEGVDYNRLEYLGDSILKVCTSLQVMAQHPTWPEGYLSRERSRIVRNRTLAEAAVALGLDRFIITKRFTGKKWRPPCVGDYNHTENESEMREMSSKTLADVVEALIGAAFVDGGLEKAYQCIRTLLPRETWFDDHLTILASAVAPCSHTSLKLLEQLVGHTFQHPTLLLEAVTHASIPFSTSGMSYERLEFLGDAILDLLVIPKLFNYPNRKLMHWQMHSLHEALVNGFFLGYCCMSYDSEESSNCIVKGNNRQMMVEHTARKVHLYDYIRAGSELHKAKALCVQKHKNVNESIHEELTTGHEYPWPQLMALGPQKFFSDIVESVLGALYIDTKGDLSVCEQFIERLGIWNIMKHLLDNQVQTVSPKERLGIAAGNEKVEYKSTLNVHTDGVRSWRCKVFVGGDEVTSIEGCEAKAEAKVKAAYKAMQILTARQQSDGGASRKRECEYDKTEVNRMTRAAAAVADEMNSHD